LSVAGTAALRKLEAYATLLHLSLVSDAVDRNAIQPAAAFEMRAVIEFMQRLRFLFGDWHAQFGREFGNHFDRLLEILQHVGPKMEPAPRA